jgi:hypothetical protein
MRLCRSWLAFGLVSIFAAPLILRAAVVYKWIDADGVVHFSDQPVEGAEKITTSSGSNHGIMTGPAGTGPTGPSAQPDRPRTTTTLASAQVTIVSPAHEQTFSGEETVTAALTVEPTPKTDRPLSITWTLNGAPVSEGTDAMSFPLPAALTQGRGSYTLGATVADPSSGESKSAEPVTFNVLRPSLLSPQHK